MRRDNTWRECGAAGKTSTQVCVPSDIRSTRSRVLTLRLLETCRRVGGLRVQLFIVRILTDTMQLHTAQEYGDGSILEHANELIDSLEAKGIKATPEDEQDDGGWKMWTRTAGTETVMETSRRPKPVPELCTDVEILELGVSGPESTHRQSDPSAAIGDFNLRRNSNQHSDPQELSAHGLCRIIRVGLRLKQGSQSRASEQGPRNTQIVLSCSLYGPALFGSHTITRQSHAHVIGSKFVSAGTELRCRNQGLGQVQ